MKNYLWKKIKEIKKSKLKCILLGVFPLIVMGIYTRAFPLEQKWFYFMFPISISVLIYYITYNVDDIACAATYAIMGISQKTMWISSIIFCSVTGYVLSIAAELIGLGIKLLAFEKDSGFLTAASISCTFLLLGLSTIHYFTNSKKQMLVASFFAVISLMLIPITILINMYLPTEQLNISIYGMIAIFSIILFVGLYSYMRKKENLELLVINSKIYIEGYDKNFFMEE